MGLKKKCDESPVMRFKRRFNSFSDIIMYFNIGVQWPLQSSLFISNSNPIFNCF